MKPGWDQHPYSVKSQERSPLLRYLLSFLWMLVFTAIAFYIVMEKVFSNPQTTFWFIFILAVLQVILQLFTFMHLDWKHYWLIVIFFSLGVIIAIVSVVIIQWGLWTPF